jgi:ankyrin repeat protein
MQPDESVVVFTQPPRDKLFRLLNGDPMVPLTSLENDSIRQVIQQYPDTCHLPYPFEWDFEVDDNVPKVDDNFPLSWLCLRQATSDVIILAYNAHPPAIHDEDRDGWSPLHYACRHKAPLEVVQFFGGKEPHRSRNDQ